MLGVVSLFSDMTYEGGHSVAFAGSAVMGALDDGSVAGLVVFSFALQIAASRLLTLAAHRAAVKDVP